MSHIIITDKQLKQFGLDVNKKVTEENHLFLLSRENLLLLIRAYQKHVADYLQGIIDTTKRKEDEVDLTNKEEVKNACITALAYDGVSCEELESDLGIKDTNDLKNHSLEKLVYLLKNVHLSDEYRTKFVPSL